MNIRYLQREERAVTRKLWEEIFQEDTKEFLDYYYMNKVTENEIIVLEEDRAIRSMVQLNPYEMVFGGETMHTNYIVGVATDKNYRHRGYMRRLLERMMDDMYQKKEPFTFLMPAAEAIYKPFDFQFIYDQNRGVIQDAVSAEEGFSCVELTTETIPQLVKFSTTVLKEHYQVFALRDEHYYHILLHEQRSQNGNIILIYKDNEVAGYFFYAEENHIEVREPVILKKYANQLLPVIKSYFSPSGKEIKCFGIQEAEAEFLMKKEQTPIIMARIIHLPAFVKSLKSTGDTKLVLEIEDKLIKKNNGVFKFSFSSDGCQLEKTEEEAEAKAGIGELTGILFGYLKAEEIFPAETARKMKMIQLPEKVFLNEIV